MLVVNAANTAKDDAHIRANLLPDTEMYNRSEEMVCWRFRDRILQHFAKTGRHRTYPDRLLQFCEHVSVGGVECLVSRTGYTGEYGYEFYCASDKVVELWDIIMETGSEFDLILAVSAHVIR